MIAEHFTTGLTGLINQLCYPKTNMVQLIHVKNTTEYNVLLRAFELRGYKPCSFGLSYTGEQYVENRNDYFTFQPNDYSISNSYYDIVEFEDYIKELA